MFRYALRLHRTGIIGYGAALLLTALSVGATYAKVAGTTAASRAMFARATTALGSHFSYLMPAPHRLDTLAGYLLWKGWGALPILVAIWAVLAGTGAARGDEDRRLVESWLAAGASRARWVVTRLVAFGCASALAVAALAAGSLLGAGGPGGGVPAGGLFAQGLAFWLLTWALFALCYAAAQVPPSARAAPAAAGGLLLVLYLVDVLGRAVGSARGVAWLSPFWWYDATDALAPGGHVATLGIVLSAALTAAAGAAAVLAFGVRDVGSGLWAWRGARPWGRQARTPSSWLARPVLRLVFRQRGALALWAVIVALVSVFIVAVAQTVATTLAGVGSLLTGAPGLRAILHPPGGNVDLSFVGFFWCGTSEMLLAGLAAQVVSAWASDDGSGILAASLSRPVSRASLVVERGAAAVVVLAVAAAVDGLAAGVAAAATGVRLPPVGLLGATALLVPFGMSFAAAGAAAGGRWPRAAAPVLGAFAFVSFFYTELGSLVGGPAWLSNVSVLKLYGNPLAGSPYWTGFWVMLAIVAAGFILAVLGLNRRDVA